MERSLRFLAFYKTRNKFSLHKNSDLWYKSNSLGGWVDAGIIRTEINSASNFYWVAVWLSLAIMVMNENYLQDSNNVHCVHYKCTCLRAKNPLELWKIMKKWKNYEKVSTRKRNLLNIFHHRGKVSFKIRSINHQPFRFHA